LPELVEQAGAVVYRRGDDGFRVLLVRARKNPTDWIFPKGHIEEDENPAQAAVREAEEEAGVTGRVVSALSPPLTFEAGGRRLRVHYFLVEYTGPAVAEEQRELVWLPPSAAVEQLTHPAARSLLTTALDNLPTLTR
jgi:8-oxo-dGTP pyrophosphatase MutT (NUDIX family)